MNGRLEMTVQAAVRVAGVVALICGCETGVVCVRAVEVFAGFAAVSCVLVVLRVLTAVFVIATAP
ncbi:hypothetical protein GCM10027430_01800 [Lysobacter tyrosinilyticus]